MSYRNIERLYNVVEKSLFRLDSSLSYPRVLDALELLADQIIKTETDETVWYIGEHGSASLDCIIVGAYWFVCDMHYGAGSREHTVMSKLAKIYEPNMSCLDNDSPEMDVYKELFALMSKPADKTEAIRVLINMISRLGCYSDSKDYVYAAKSVMKLHPDLAQLMEVSINHVVADLLIYS